MIEICVRSHPGEGGLKSVCDIVMALINQRDCFKIFVIDDCNSICVENKLGDCNVICKLSKDTFLSAIHSKGKIVLIKNEGIFSDIKELYVQAKELFGTQDNNAYGKIYLIYKDLGMKMASPKTVSNKDFEETI